MKKSMIASIMGTTITLFHTNLHSDSFQQTILQEIKTIVQSTDYILNTIDVSTLSIKTNLFKNTLQHLCQSWLETSSQKIWGDRSLSQAR